MRKMMIVLLALVAIGCGSRRVNKSMVSSSETVTTEVSESAVEQTDVVVRSESSTVMDVVVYDEILQPVDPDRPIVKTETVEGGIKITTWRNAQVSNKAVTDKSVVSESVVLTDQSVKQSDFRYRNDEDRESEAKDKITSVSGGFWYWGMILAVLGVVWWVNRRFL